MSEHHFTDDGYLPSLLPFAVAVAARTERVSIGTNVLLMAFHYPLRVAEDCAVIDNLSDGRFIFGPAVGYRREEFDTFGVNRRHRGRNSLYQMRHYARWFSEAGENLFGEPPKDLAELESRGIYRVGTPAEICEIIRQEYAAAPYERYFFFPIWPGVDIELATTSVRLFAEQVIPELRDL